jgi:hypothetical protein
MTDALDGDEIDNGDEEDPFLVEWAAEPAMQTGLTLTRA